MLVGRDAAIVHRLRFGDDLAQCFLGQCLGLATLVGGDDDPYWFGIGALGRPAGDFAGDDVSLVLVLQMVGVEMI